MPHSDLIVDGVKWPSVTEVLSYPPKPWLQKWRDKWGVLAERKTACANTIGTAFHSGAEKLSRCEYVEYPGSRRVGKMLERIEEWLETDVFVPKDTERHVVSTVHKYHGTLDATGTILRYGKTLIIVDYKSSSAIYEEMAEQLAAYAEAYYEETGIRIRKGLIVHVSKDKPGHKLTVKEYKLTKALFNKFLKRLRAYNGAIA